MAGPLCILCRSGGIPFPRSSWTVGPAALPCAGGLPPQRPPPKPSLTDSTPSFLQCGTTDPSPIPCPKSCPSQNQTNHSSDKCPHQQIPASSPNSRSPDSRPADCRPPPCPKSCPSQNQTNHSSDKSPHQQIPASSPNLSFPRLPDRIPPGARALNHVHHKIRRITVQTKVRIDGYPHPAPFFVPPIPRAKSALPVKLKCTRVGSPS